MKLVLISDTHGLHSQMKHNLPKGDLLIHAGDLTNVGKKEEVYEVLEWLRDQAKNYTHGVVFIVGNHDRSFDPKYFRQHEDYDLWKYDNGKNKPFWLSHALSDLELSDYGVTYLENSSIEITEPEGKKYKIWGSPITPWFGGDFWAFNEHRGPDIAKIWEQIPEDTDIVVTHGPMMFLNDFIPNQGVFVGCEQLRDRVETIKPKLFVCGHVHEGYGIGETKDTIYVNASVCDERYRPVNEPITVEI